MSKILLSEDDSSLREFITEILEDNGFDVTSVENGELAIQAIRKNQFDLLITDIIMPRMNGLSLIKEVKTINKNIPIIAMSAGGANKAEDYLNAAKTCGVNHVIEKPIKALELLEAIRSELG